MPLYHSKVYGIVQGVGFRPFVDRLAARFKILGSVCNKGPYVEIFAEGSEKTVQAFLAALNREAPERSAILKVDTNLCPQAGNYTTFSIIESAKERGDIFVSPDIATCDKCQQELFDPTNRRYLHPFINCTACGPRLTILDSMPYDRERTSMKDFPLCEACHSEYVDPNSRRYDAQPVCCNDCGPEVYLLENASIRNAAAITHTRQVIMRGGIVAIKGIGGFHLCCDAKNAAAVQKLRQLKHRPVKPFAVMVRDLTVAKRECQISDKAAAILTGHQKPIILLPRKLTGQISEFIAPDNPKIGLMLPYAPVQMLLFDYPDDVKMTDCLLMTSGNPSGAPICRDDKEATAALNGFTDSILSHNRQIRIRADDTVMDFLADEPYMIRRSRGYAPLPFMLTNNWQGQVLGIGGELKNTFCVGTNNLFYPSPYVGDMSDLRTVMALKETIGRLTELLEVKPTIVACDLHPRYNTTTVAQELNLPVFPVQHHYAHILACLAENDYKDYEQNVIGVAFDGTGFGGDDTIWGGEIMLASYAGFKRIGHIKPFLQAGGDKSSTEGWRIAVAMIYALNHNNKPATQEIVTKLQLCQAMELQAQYFMLDSGINTVTSTSAGRLFDAVSAILGIRQKSTFEGEASMYLEFAAEKYLAKVATPTKLPAIKLLNESMATIELATDALVDYLLTERLKNELSVTKLAYEFHALLADQIEAACLVAKEQTNITTVAISGGVFQNNLLTRLVSARLKKQGFTVLRHHLLPPNDGGIAVGQAVAAMWHINQKNEQ